MRINNRNSNTPQQWNSTHNEYKQHVYLPFEILRRTLKISLLAIASIQRIKTNKTNKQTSMRNNSMQTTDAGSASRGVTWRCVKARLMRSNREKPHRFPQQSQSKFRAKLIESLTRSKLTVGRYSPKQGASSHSHNKSRISASRRCM